MGLGLGLGLRPQFCGRLHPAREHTTRKLKLAPPRASRDIRAWIGGCGSKSALGGEMCRSWLPVVSLWLSGSLVPGFCFCFWTPQIPIPL